MALPNARLLDLPIAKNASPPSSDPAPKIFVSNEKVMLDGQVIGDVHEILELHRIQRVVPLFDALIAKPKQWRAVNPNAGVPGVALLGFDAKTPAFVVKAVFQTAAFAGYPNSAFAVRDAAGTTQRLHAEAQVPRRHSDGSVASGVVLLGDLASHVKQDWALYAVHRESRDPVFDQAILYVDDDLEYQDIIAVLDGIAGTTRAVGARRVPALNVTLSIGHEMSKSNDPLARNRMAPETIQKIIRTHVPRFRSCYGKSAAKNPSLRGIVRLRFTIQPSGTVSGLGSQDSTLNDADAVKCILLEASTMTFPAEPNSTGVTYPLKFGVSDVSP